MRWFQVNAVVLAAVALAGCPSEFGKDGRIGKAVEKDVKEQLDDLPFCSEEYVEEVCYGPKIDKAECDRCGGG
ncbi:MAG TPA: hypothetical protein VK539_29310 [Myxococcaceae bacterium]|nr:hypothetical protein [Myxococcaceae bacterium]